MPPAAFTMTRGKKFSASITIPSSSILTTLAGWTAKATMREGEQETDPIILDDSQLVATVADEANRIVLLTALPAVTSTVEQSGYFDVWITKTADPTDSHPAKRGRIELMPRSTIA